MAQVQDWKPLFARLFTAPRGFPSKVKDHHGRDMSMTTSMAAPSISEQRILSMLKDSQADRIAQGLPLRLHASRLRAAFTSAEVAGRAIGVQGRSYRSIENGSRPPSPRIIEGASRVFGVSLEFLLVDLPYIEVDIDASNLTPVLKDLTGASWSDDKTIGDRLKQARRDAGFRSAKDAIEQNGWRTSAYKAHEAGLVKIPVDRIVLYAQAFGTDARRLAIDAWPEPDLDPSTVPESSEAGVTTRCRRAPATDVFGAAPDRSAWPWLVPLRTTGGALTLQVVGLSELGSFLPSGLPLIVPAFHGRLPDGNNQVYAVLNPNRRGTRGLHYLILRRFLGEDCVSDLIVSDGRRLIRGLPPSDKMVEGDPLLVCGTWAKPLILGRQIGEFRLRMDVE